MIYLSILLFAKTLAQTEDVELGEELDLDVADDEQRLGQHDVDAAVGPFHLVVQDGWGLWYMSRADHEWSKALNFPDVIRYYLKLAFFLGR